MERERRGGGGERERVRGKVAEFYGKMAVWREA